MAFRDSYEICVVATIARVITSISPTVTGAYRRIAWLPPNSSLRSRSGRCAVARWSLR